MKKFLSILMVLTMVLSLSVTAFAAENTGSITITNATIGDSYSLYKIFDATYSVDANGNADAVSYSIAQDNQFFSYLFGAANSATISLSDRMAMGWMYFLVTAIIIVVVSLIVSLFVYNENDTKVKKSRG